MKAVMALFLLGVSTFASAEICTSVIKDRYGYEYESYTRSSYSQQAACDQASYDCQQALSYAQSTGRYYDAQCVLKFDNPVPNPYPNPYPPYPGPNPYPNPQGVVCQTDLVDYYGRLVRSFTAPGQGQYDACNASDNFCKAELARNDSYGARCVTRGLIDNRNDPRPPSRTRTEQCTANRYDPAGMFIQSYTQTATGPINSDVRGQACSYALNDCNRDLRGRQTCQIAR
jgi:hypothetical protein